MISARIAAEGSQRLGSMDLRESLAQLEKEGHLRRVGAAVAWDREVGAVARRVLEKKGPALLFENIKGYETGRCTRLLTGALGHRARLALALGFPPDPPNSDLAQYGMKMHRTAGAPNIVGTGPVKDVAIMGPQ